MAVRKPSISGEGAPLHMFIQCVITTYSQAFDYAYWKGASWSTCKKMLTYISLNSPELFGAVYSERTLKRPTGASNLCYEIQD